MPTFLSLVALACDDGNGSPWPPGSHAETDTDSTDQTVSSDDPEETATDVGETDQAETEGTDVTAPPDAGLDAGVPAAPPGSFALDFDRLPLPSSVDLVTDFHFLPGVNEMLVASLDGTMHRLVLDGDDVERIASFELPDVYYERDCGLISLAIDPAYEDNGFIYVGYCVDVRGSGVFRMHYDPDDMEASVASLAEVLVVHAEPRENEADERPWHNVGSLSFDDEGALWVPFGDKVRRSEARDTSNALGSLVRVFPNRDPEGAGYEAPEDNPFADGHDGFDAIYAWGLRSPWRGLLDGDGRFWVGDVGAIDYDEIDVVAAPGVNMGWPAYEGPCAEDCGSFVNPVTGWDRDLDHPYMLDDPDVNPLQARVPYVGIAYHPVRDRYRGHLNRRVLFGDFCTGYVRAGEVDDTLELVYDEHVGHVDNPSAWRQGPDGYIYVTTYGRCQTDAENFTDGASQFFRVVLD